MPSYLENSRRRLARYRQTTKWKSAWSTKAKADAPVLAEAKAAFALEAPGVVPSVIKARLSIDRRARISREKHWRRRSIGKIKRQTRKQLETLAVFEADFKRDLAVDLLKEWERETECRTRRITRLLKDPRLRPSTFAGRQRLQ